MILILVYLTTERLVYLLGLHLVLPFLLDQLVYLPVQVVHDIENEVPAVARHI